MVPDESYFKDPDFQRLEAVFPDYVAQGKGRNVTWLAAKTGLPLATCAKGMVKGFWLQRIQAVGTQAANVVRDQAATAEGRLVGDVAGMNSRDVAALTELELAAAEKLLNAIRADEVKPDTLFRIVAMAMGTRRKILGLEDGKEETTPLQKLLEKTATAGGKVVSKPFVLDPKSLEAPADLPTMPGMTSDAEQPEDPQRELDDEEKRLLRDPRQ